MNENERMRIECKKLKAFQDISYTEIAEYLEIKRNSFYSWLNGQYDFSYNRLQSLKIIIENLSE